MSLCDECGGEWGHSESCPVPRRAAERRSIEAEAERRVERREVEALRVENAELRRARDSALAQRDGVLMSLAEATAVRDEARAECERLQKKVHTQYAVRPNEEYGDTHSHPWHSPRCYEGGAHRDESLCTCGLTQLCRERDALRAAITAAEKGPAVVSAGEIAARLTLAAGEAVAIPTVAEHLAALCAERTSAAVEKAHREAVRTTADVFTKMQSAAVADAVARERERVLSEVVQHTPRCQAEARRIQMPNDCHCTCHAMETRDAIRARAPAVGEEDPGERCHGGWPGGVHQFEEHGRTVSCPVCGGSGWKRRPSSGKEEDRG